MELIIEFDEIEIGPVGFEGVLRFSLLTGMFITKTLAFKAELVKGEGENYFRAKLYSSEDSPRFDISLDQDNLNIKLGKSERFVFTRLNQFLDAFKERRGITQMYVHPNLKMSLLVQIETPEEQRDVYNFIYGTHWFH